MNELEHSSKTLIKDMVTPRSPYVAIATERWLASRHTVHTSKMSYQIDSCMILLLSLDCAEGWHQYRTGCIKFFTISLPKTQAKERCKEFITSNQIQGNLIKIPSSADNDQVASLSPKPGGCFGILLLINDHIYNQTRYFLTGTPTELQLSIQKRSSVKTSWAILPTYRNLK